MKNKNLKLKINQNNPIQYQKGYVEFYKLRFIVTPDVLIPRPETELLVDEVIRFLSNHPERSRACRGRVEGSLVILDIGTGAGNIAISIAKNLAPHLKSGNVNITATDVSSKALKVARQNARLHGVENKIAFLVGNLLNFSHKSHGREIMGDHNIIVTNLPYIPSARIPYLDSSVKDFEPLIALDGGPDGFDLYRKLFVQIKKKGWRPKLIVGEIDYTHGELAQNEAQKYFPKAKVEVKTDLAHKQRILIIEQ